MDDENESNNKSFTNTTTKSSFLMEHNRLANGNTFNKRRSTHTSLMPSSTSLYSFKSNTNSTANANQSRTLTKASMIKWKQQQKSFDHTNAQSNQEELLNRAHLPSIGALCSPSLSSATSNNSFSTHETTSDYSGISTCFYVCLFGFDLVFLLLLMLLLLLFEFVGFRCLLGLCFSFGVFCLFRSFNLFSY